jgi:hypothetical protein
MRLVPEVIIINEDTLARFEEIIVATTAEVDRQRDAVPQLDEVFRRNGWTSRAWALGLLLAEAGERALGLLETGDQPGGG